MTQEELNKIPPTPDLKNFVRLEIDKTIPLVVDSLNRVSVTATLRVVEDGTAMVQFTFAKWMFAQGSFEVAS